MAAMLLLPITMALGLIHPARPVKWSVEAVERGPDAVVVRVMASLEDGWHIYATKLPREDGPLPTVFRFSSANTHEGPVGSQEPVAVEEMDPNFGMLVRHHSGSPVFEWHFKRLTTEPFQIAGEVEYMMCNDRTCLPPVIEPFMVNVPASVTK